MTGVSDPEMLAFIGGRSVNQVGPVNDLLCFFACLKEFARETLDASGERLLLDRFYKRYLRLDELKPAGMAMNLVQERFRTVPSSCVDWPAKGLRLSHTNLRLDQPTIADVLAKFFVRFQDCLDSAYSMNKSASIYRPVKISRGDFASLDREKKRPIGEYDALDGPPFWLAEPARTAPSPSFKDGKEVPHGTPGSVRPNFLSADGSTATFEAKFTD